MSCYFFLLIIPVLALIKAFGVYRTEKDGIRFKDLITDRYIPWDEIDEVRIKLLKPPLCEIRSKISGIIRFSFWGMENVDTLFDEIKKHVPEEKFK